MKVFRAAVLLVALALSTASSIAAPRSNPQDPTSIFTKIVRQIRHVIGLDDITFPKP